MTEIKFKPNYGYAHGSPQWLVAALPSDGYLDNREDAEQAAATMALTRPGVTFGVFAMLATVSTSTEVIGVHFSATNPKERPGEEAKDMPAVDAAFEGDVL